MGSARRACLIPLRAGPPTHTIPPPIPVALFLLAGRFRPMPTQGGLTMTPLRLKMLEDLRIRNFAPSTQINYIRYVSRFAQHFGRSPDELGPDEIRAFQLHLLQDAKVSYGVLAQFVSALRFFYRVTLGKPWTIERIPYPKAEKPLPDIPTREEILQFLDSIANIKHRTILTTCYATGLRVSEVARLRVEDVDSRRGVIHVRLGKGRKDRLVPLSPALLEALRT